MISSRQNPHFKRLVKLHKPREREREGLFLVEGEKEISLAKDLVALYYTDRTPFVDKIERGGVETFALAPELFAEVSYRERGVLAIAKIVELPLEILEGKCFLLLVQGIEKPGNLGAMLRTASSAGIEGVIVADPICDLHNPNLIRASLGAFFTQPIVTTTSQEAIQFLKREKITPLLTSPHAKKPYFAVNYTQPICIVIGSEAEGLPPVWFQQGFCEVLIPMKGGVDSLNASVSAAILLYEAVRQRNSLL